MVSGPPGYDVTVAAGRVRLRDTTGLTVGENPEAAAVATLLPLVVLPPAPGKDAAAKQRNMEMASIPECSKFN